MRFDLSISRCRGQCYDGASNMPVNRNGVKSQLQNEEKRALYVHCYGHVLSLCVSDTIKSIAPLRSCMDTTYKISKLIQYSPKRANHLKNIQVNMYDHASGFRILCPTRWTVRNETFCSYIDNYTVLLELWGEILNQRIYSDMRARVSVCVAK